MLKIFYIRAFFLSFLLVVIIELRAQINQIPGLVLWLKADTGVVFDSNYKISEWNDASGNNIQFIQPNTNLQPIYFPSVDSMNNKPAIKLQNSSLYTTQTLNIRSIYILANYDYDQFLNYAGLFTRNSIIDGTTDYLFVSTIGGYHFYPSILGQNIYINQIPTTNFAPLKRPKIIYGFSNNLLIWNDALIGWDRRIVGRFWKGMIYEILIFNQLLNAEQHQIVMNYLMDKYAPDVELPSDTNLTTFCPYLIQPQGYYTSYLWNTESTNSTIQIQSSGTYSVTVTDIFGRQSTDSMVIHFPFSGFQSNMNLCFNDSILLDTQLDTTLYDFVWNNSSTNNYLVVYNPGQYWLTITDTAGCEFNSDTVNVSLDTFHLENVLPDTIELCLNDTLSAYHVQALQYLWVTGETTFYILPQTTGWYFITVTNTYGCKQVDSCYVQIKGQKPEPIIVKGNTCVNSLVHYSGLSSGNIQFWQWTFQDSLTFEGQQVDFIYDSIGIYSTVLHVVDSNGCDAFAFSVDTIFSKPQATFTSTPLCHSNQYLLESNFISDYLISQYFWIIDQQVYTGNPVEINLNSSQETVLHVIENIHGCRDTVLKKIHSVSILPPVQANVNYPQPYQNIVKNPITISWNNYQQFSRLELSYQSNFATIFFQTPKSLQNSCLIQIGKNKTIYGRIWTYNHCNDSVSTLFMFTTFEGDSIQGLSLWLRSDTGVVLDANQRVIQWNDLSVNNTVWESSVINNGPLYHSDIDSMNNYPTISFTNHALVNNELINLGTLYLIANYNFNSFLDYSGLFTRKTVIDANSDYLLKSNASGTYFYGSALLNDGLFINNNQTYNFAPLKRPKIIKGLLDEVIQWEDAQIGLDRINSGRYWKGNIWEIIGYNKILTSDEQDLVEKYLMDKYAPPVLLPADTVLTTFCPFVIKPKGYFHSYQWNTGETTDSIVVTQTGKYLVTVTDIFGRISRDSIFVTFPNPYPYDTLVLCYGDSVLVTSEYGNLMTYQWNNGHTKSYAYLKNEGWYVVTVTDRNKCTGLDSFFVKLDSLSLLSLWTSDTISLCEGNFLSVGSTPYTITNYLWFPTADTTPKTIVTTQGWYGLEVKDINQCIGKDSVYVNILGKAPIVNFTASHTCLGDSTELISTSYSQDASPLNFWQWKFNQTTTINGSQVNYLFNNYGQQLVELTVGTEAGCFFTLSDTVMVYPLPSVSFIVSGFCEEQQTSFTSVSSIPFGQIVEYIWNFGDGQAANIVNPQHTYSSSGIYTVSLTAISNEACQQTFIKEIEIKDIPQAGFIVGATCQHSYTTFTDTSNTLPYFPIIQWKWNFGDGTQSSQQNPVHVYQSIGNYSVSLVVKSLNGCTDTVIKNITVSSSPQAGFTHDSACVGQPLQLHDTSFIANGIIQSWKWYVGQTLYSVQPQVVIIPESVGNLSITLIVESNTFCKDTIVKVLQVHSKPMVNFVPEPTYGVAPLTVYFENLSDEGQAFWNFSDGNVSTVFSPQHTFENIGNYKVWLVLTNQFGCVDSIFKNIMVVPHIIDLAITDLQTYTQQSYLYVSAKVQNFGTLPIENPVLQLWVNGRFMIAETLYDTLFSGEYSWYLFNGFINSQWTKPDYVCVQGELNASTSEVDISNNTFCKSVNEEEHILNIRPNPVTDELVIELQLSENQAVEIKITEITGKQLLSKRVSLPKNYNRLTLDVSSLSQGIYLIQIKSTKISVAHSFIKL